MYVEIKMIYQNRYAETFSNIKDKKWNWRRAMLL